MYLKICQLVRRTLLPILLLFVMSCHTLKPYNLTEGNNGSGYVLKEAYVQMVYPGEQNSQPEENLYLVLEAKDSANVEFNYLTYRSRKYNINASELPQPIDLNQGEIQDVKVPNNNSVQIFCTKNGAIMQLTIPNIEVKEPLYLP